VKYPITTRTTDIGDDIVSQDELATSMLKYNASRTHELRRLVLASGQWVRARVGQPIGNRSITTDVFDGFDNQLLLTFTTDSTQPVTVSYYDNQDQLVQLTNAPLMDLIDDQTEAVLMDNQQFANIVTSTRRKGIVEVAYRIDPLDFYKQAAVKMAVIKRTISLWPDNPANVKRLALLDAQRLLADFNATE